MDQLVGDSESDKTRLVCPDQADQRTQFPLQLIKPNKTLSTFLLRSHCRERAQLARSAPALSPATASPVRSTPGGQPQTTPGFRRVLQVNCYVCRDMRGVC